MAVFLLPHQCEPLIPGDPHHRALWDQVLLQAHLEKRLDHRRPSQAQTDEIRIHRLELRGSPSNPRVRPQSSYRVCLATLYSRGAWTDRRPDLADSRYRDSDRVFLHVPGKREQGPLRAPVYADPGTPQTALKIPSPSTSGSSPLPVAAGGARLLQISPCRSAARSCSLAAVTGCF